MTFLTKEVVAAAADKAKVVGYGILGDVTPKPMKGDKTFLLGSIRLQGGNTVPYKMWPGAELDLVQKNSKMYVGTPIVIEAEINDYQGTRQLIISRVSPLPDGTVVDSNEFYKEVYNSNELEKELLGLFNTELSPEGRTIFKALYHTEFRARFRVEGAAVSMHDAVIGGLLAHSLKATKLAMQAWHQFPALAGKIDKDLAFLGTLFHDMGKVHEYLNLQKGEFHWVVHHAFGIEMLADHKALIFEQKNEEWYRRFQSILLQHHGQWGEKPRTIEAYFVHLVDNFDANMTTLAESVDSNSNGPWPVDGFKLE